MIAATPGRRRLPRAVRTLLGLVILLLSLLPPLTAHAKASASLVVALTAVSQTGTAPTDTVTLSGTVRNAADVPVYSIRALVWRSTAPLRSTDAVEAALTGTPPAGRTVTSKPEHVHTITGPDAALLPGDSRPFVLHATLGDLGLTTTDATYWLGVNVRGTSESVSGTAELATARTLLTLPGSSPTPLTSIIELAAVPRQVRANLFADDGLAEELSGRLRTLVTAAAQPGASWVVDPALIAEVTDMADGYRVVDGTSTRPGAGAEVAKQWLAAFRALPTTAGYQSLFARPDVTGAVAVHDPAVLPHARAAAKAVNLDLPTLVTLERVDAPTLTALGAEHPVLTRAPQLPSRSTVLRGVRLLEAVAPDAPLDSRVLADTPLNRAAALVARARAAGGQVRLIDSPAGLDADRAASPSWLTHRPFATFAASDPVPTTRTLPVEPDSTSTYDRSAARRVASLVAGMSNYGAVAPQSRVVDLADAQAARGASLAWEDGAARDAWLALVDAWSGNAALAGGLTVTASPRFTMTAAESDFPVTITNTLPDAVTLRLVTSSESPQRIRLTAGEAVTVASGASQGVAVHASASGNGVASATIHAATPDGVRLTADVPLVLEATNLGAVGWLIIVVSGAVLLVSTALRIRQVRRRSGGADGQR